MTHTIFRTLKSKQLTSGLPSRQGMRGCWINCLCLTQCRSTISTLLFLFVLNHPHNLQSMVSKLPFPLQDRWCREANKIRTVKGEILTFADFVRFVNAEAVIAMDAVLSREALQCLGSTSQSTSDRSDHSNKGKVSGKSKHPGDCTCEPFNISNHATDVTADRESNFRLCKLCGKTMIWIKDIIIYYRSWNAIAQHHLMEK